MSILKQASLLMYPSGYKEDKLYSILPKDGSGDLSFARSSVGTRVNAEGLIETVPYNLINYSQDFTNGVWTPNGVVATLNSGTAPDGTNTLNDVSSDNSNVQENRFRYATSLAVSTTYTISVFCKVKDINNFYIRDLTGGGGVSIINVATSTVLVTGSGSTVSIVDFGSGIKRVIVTFTTPSSIGNNLIDFGITSSNTDRQSAIAIGSGMYFWGAMINEGSSAKTYLKTESGLNIPRIDYLGGGCGKLLLEPQRTNTVLYNSDYTQYWANANVLVTQNATISPNGNNDAQKLTSANTFGQHYIREIRAGHTVGAPHVYSCFAKAAELDILTLRLLNGGGQTYTDFDLTNGTHNGGANGKMIDFGNGWWRCISYHASSTSQYLYPYIYTKVGNTQGDGVSGFYVYGAMIEEGTYETSLIDTTTTTVTRTQDTSITTGLSSVIGQTEGTLQFKFEKSKIIEDYAVISLMSTGTDAIMIGTRNLSPANDSLRLLFFKANVLTLNLTLATNIGNGTFNVAVAYKLNDWSVFVDGVEVYTNTSVAAPSLLTELRLLNRFGTAYNFSYPVENLSLFTTRLSNTELATLTTL